MHGRPFSVCPSTNMQSWGFDFDYTLAHYTPALTDLIYDLAKRYLVKK